MSLQQGFTITSEIMESKSAKAPGVRVEFAKMLKLIEKGKADAILCWSVNRLSRNPVDSGLLSWMLQTGVLKCIQTPERTYLPEDNVLLFAVETGVANQFILDLKKGVLRGMRSKVEKGWFPHRAPEGYDNNLRERTIEKDPVRFDLLQRGWRLILDERKSVKQVLDTLNNGWGYQTRSAKQGFGKAMHASMAYRIFSNPFYAGYFRFNGQLHKGLHPPMITLEEFEKAQVHLRGQLGKRHKSKHNFPYVGMITCRGCGRKLTASVSKGRLQRGNWVYYHCGNVQGVCNKRGIREDLLEARINDCLTRIRIVPEFKEVVMTSLEEWIQVEFGTHERIYGNQLHLLAENEKLQNELFEMRLRQLIDDEQFRAKQSELRMENARLRERVSGTEQRIEQVRATVEGAMEFRLRAQEEFMLGDSEKRRAIVQSLGGKYVYETGEVYMELHPLLTYTCSPIQGGVKPQERGSGTSESALISSSFLYGTASEEVIEPIPTTHSALWAIFCALLDSPCVVSLPPTSSAP
ncbi:MAG: recombinase family protein [Armatimonadetes bacterium]|nr:recombinase family protein [Armatimonadota bacterium]